MLRSLPLLLALTLAACSVREIDEEPPSRRDIAAQWCEDWCTFWYACEPFYEGMPVSGCREGCESDEAWDWTDECGDIKWDYRECKLSSSCEELLDDPEIVGTDNPCQHHLDEALINGCTYDRPHGG